MDSSSVPNPPQPEFGVDHGHLPIVQNRLQIFEFQDLENDLFDVTFEIEGKKLHAHKFTLSSQSEIFKTMFSARWSTNNAPIQIANRTFDDFKKFIGFMYFAPIHLTSNNFMSIVDMAEYYGVQWIKDKCDEWLSAREEFAPLLDLYKAVNRYSLLKSKTAIFSYILENCLKTPEMVRDHDIPREIIMDMVTFQRSYASEESLFKAVYYWANEKHRNLDNSLEALHQAMKIELADILPHMKFRKMSTPFFKSFISPKKHIFDDDSWKEIKRLLDLPQVTLKYKNEYKLKGVMFADEKIVDFIKSLENEAPSSYRDSVGCYWMNRCRIPSKPSQLKIKRNVDFYLCITADYRRIAVKQRSCLKNGDYLLAELYGSGSFYCSKHCRISVI